MFIDISYQPSVSVVSEVTIDIDNVQLTPYEKKWSPKVQKHYDAEMSKKVKELNAETNFAKKDWMKEQIIMFSRNKSKIQA